ncbi:MAG TPA: phosphoribosylanthranilate isomerase [Kofleriaceae bacterium]
MNLKICGVTTAADVALVAASGATHLGLNFWPRSKRFVGALDPLRDSLRAAQAAGIQLVGVFVNATVDEITEAVARASLDIVQLHGDESAGDALAIEDATARPIWKAVSLAGPADVDELDAWPVAALLLDAPRGGSGVTFDWSLAAEARRRDPQRRFVLAGGLTPDNVAAAIAEVRPWAVDVASGCESAPGVKDPAKLAAFVDAVLRGQA